MTGNDIAVGAEYRLQDGLQVAPAAVPCFLTMYFPQSAQRSVYHYEQSYYWP